MINSKVAVVFLTALIVLTGTIFAQAMTTDEIFYEIAKNVPGFAGLYIDDNLKILYINLVDTSKLPEAEKAVKERADFASLKDFKTEAVKVQYDWIQLTEWRKQTEGDIFSVQGVVSIDIDEKRNRFVIGVENNETAKAVAGRIKTLPVPREAVIIEVTGPIIEDVLIVDATTGLPIKQEYREDESSLQAEADNQSFLFAGVAIVLIIGGIIYYKKKVSTS